MKSLAGVTVEHCEIVVGVTGQLITGDYVELPNIDLKEFAVKDKKELPIQYEFTGEGKENADGSYGVVRLRFDADLKPDQKEKVQKALTETIDTFAARPQPDRCRLVTFL